MSEDVRKKAAAATPLVSELNAAALPEVSTELVPLRGASPEQVEEIRRRMDEIDLTDSGSICLLYTSDAADE